MAGPIVTISVRIVSTSATGRLGCGQDRRVPQAARAGGGRAMAPRVVTMV
ncbi:hypothetical protein SXCC_04412 [Gluconacetobacter sp. SXCC-1]|nr:hypothetical protein SXCC_04412 [Gluconacetobacter sp. SXCC-1]